MRTDPTALFRCRQLAPSTRRSGRRTPPFSLLRRPVLGPLAGAVMLALLLACTTASAERWRGRVVKVADGDTVTVLRDGEPVKIRLEGVDTPEKKQAFGQAAKRFTLRLVGGKTVEVEGLSKDKYGRTLGRITVGKKRLDHELLRAGMAWHYKHYNKDKTLARLERQARAAKRGLWAQPKPQAPWDWRRAQRAGQARQQILDKVRTPGSGVAVTADGPLRGNVRSKRYHHPSCGAYRCKNCTRTFPSAEAAERAGFKPCGNCGDRIKRGAAAAAPEAEKEATPTPPGLPRSKDRACRKDGDCVLMPRSPCSCPPCGDVWRLPGNRAALKRWVNRWAVRRCRKPRCKPCKGRFLGREARCIKGQCAVVP